MCCSVLHCVAVCCIVLPCVAVCCSMLQCVAVCCSVLQCLAVCCSALQCIAVHCSVLHGNRVENHRLCAAHEMSPEVQSQTIQLYKCVIKTVSLFSLSFCLSLCTAQDCMTQHGTPNTIHNPMQTVSNAVLEVFSILREIPPKS